MEEYFLPLETQSQGSTPVITSEPEGKGKGKRHSESLITAKTWTQIFTQRSRKLENPESMQGKPTLITCTGRITIINPVVTSKGKFPKAVFNKVIQGTVKARGHLGHSGGWQDIEGNYTHSAIYLPIKQKTQTRGLEGYGSSSSTPPTPQRSFLMDHGQQEVQPSIQLGRTLSKFPEDMSQSNTLKTSYDNHQRMEFQQAVQIPGGESNQDKEK
ncbi:hypothetical protein O181_006705 [Austropuccinia psidii MF-1]|uniref:Uncharacterized protein n=1 Tax=Austropuccinia psidii MF-1 TaxID=1389203 RepID=A0A9Q3GH46_9BASI|nr:hypothetical protein [Austropuccinia psidii MF-1]